MRSFVNPQAQKCKSAFTLIELLVVVAIIAILASILFPVFARARENARKSSCQSNLKQLGTAVQMYRQDYNEQMMPTGQTEAICPRTRLSVYTKSNQIWVCPSETNKTTQGGTTGTSVSYNFNNKVGAVLDSQVPRASEVIVTTDSDPSELGWLEGNSWDAGKTTDWSAYLPDGCTDSNANKTVSPCGADSYKASWFQRHNGTFNALFYDGHVKGIPASPSTLTRSNYVP